MKMPKTGFTLVELSIVLVIIGLLIGGILVAQSMIGTARIQAVIKEVGQYDAAVENFQTKYKQLPGDTNLMGDNPGNNNGLIADVYQSGVYFQGDVAKFWSDLSNSGLARPEGGKYLDGSVGVSPDNTYVPRSKAGVNTSVMVLGSPLTNNNYYVFLDITNRSTGFVLYNLAGSFYASEILSVDTKIDDGLANSGNVKGWIYPAVGLNTFRNDGVTYDNLENTDNTCLVSTNSPKYNVADKTNLCAIRIRLGSMSGNLK